MLISEMRGKQYADGYIDGVCHALGVNRVELMNTRQPEAVRIRSHIAYHLLNNTCLPITRIAEMFEMQSPESARIGYGCFDFDRHLSHDLPDRVVVKCKATRGQVRDDTDDIIGTIEQTYG